MANTLHRGLLGFRGLFGFDLLQVFATHTLAGFLADRAAVTASAAGTEVFPLHLEALFFPVDHKVGLATFDFGHFGFDQIFAASALALFFGHGVAVTAFAAAANIDLITLFELHFAGLSSEPRTHENDGKNKGQTNKNCFPHDSLLLCSVV
jgi:hypothetical protein